MTYQNNPGQNPQQWNQSQPGYGQPGGYAQAQGFQQPVPAYAQPQMSQAPVPPGMRLLTIEFKKPAAAGYAWLTPTVAIDGREYATQWGFQQFIVPADRPVHIGIWVLNVWKMGIGTFFLAPNQPPFLEYAAPAQAFHAGQIGPPNTTRARGRGTQIALAVTAGCLLLFTLLIFLVIFLALTTTSM